MLPAWAEVFDQRYQETASRNAGSFSSRPPNGVNRCQAVFGEMLEAFDHLLAKPPYERERSVAECGEDLRRMPEMSACLIFPACHITHVMQAVLDPPMRPRQGQQLGWAARMAATTKRTGDLRTEPALRVPKPVLPHASRVPSPPAPPDEISAC